jgi:hypothetical protein
MATVARFARDAVDHCTLLHAGTPHIQSFLCPGYRRIKSEHCDIGFPTGVRRVAFTDSEEILHSVEVEADSLYEAVALAVAKFRCDEVIMSEPGAMTEFIVTVFRKPTEHRIRLSQVAW